MAELQPHGEVETLLADLIVSDSWRLKRAVKMETVYIQGALERYTNLAARASPEKIMAKLKVEPLESVPWKVMILDDMNDQGGLLNLERYRTAVERHLHRSLNELRRLQAGRRGEKIPPTLAIDVDVSSDN